ncbi:hypothetical protein GN956_G9215 [Arapaima gigas]
MSICLEYKRRLVNFLFRNVSSSYAAGHCGCNRAGRGLVAVERSEQCGVLLRKHGEGSNGGKRREEKRMSGRWWVTSPVSVDGAQGNRRCCNR